MDPIDYYVLIDDYECGPYSISMLKELMDTGRINRDTLYAQQGMERWEPIRSIEPALFPPPKPKSRPLAPVMPQTVVPVEKVGTMRLWLLAIGGTVAAAVLLLLIAIPFLHEPSPPKAGSRETDQKFEAYYSAREFVKRTYPGAQNVSPFSESVVNKEGKTYYVAVTAENLNSSNGPVRHQVGLILHLDGDTWKLDHIEQR